MNIRIIMSLLVLSHTIIFEQNNTVRAEPEDYEDPAISKIILLYHKHYIEDEGGRVILKKHVLTKVIKDEGRDTNIATLVFNAYFEKLKISLARTIQPDGSLIDVSPEDIAEASPYGALPMYSEIKIKRITFPEVKVGSIIEYEAEYTMDYKTLPVFSALFTVPIDSMVVLARFSVDVPQDKKVRFKAEKIKNPEPVITSSDGKDTYTWEIKNIHLKDEPFLPSYMRFGPYILFSTIQSWDNVSNGYKKLIFGSAQTDENISNAVKGLIKGAEDNRDKIIKNLYDYVSRNIQYVPIELGLSSFRPRLAAEVFENRYGDCKGKSALLISMLKAVGIEAYYALVFTTSYGFIEHNIPITFFNHAIVAIPENDGYLFIDPTVDMLSVGMVPFEIQGSSILVLSDKGPELVNIAVDSAEQNITYTKSYITIKSDGSINVDTKETFSGQEEWRQRLTVRYTTASQYKEIFQKEIDAIAGNMVLTDVKISDYQNLNMPFEIEMTADAADYARKSGNLVIFRIPHTLDPLVSAATAFRRRENPLFISCPKVLKYRTFITIPEEYTVKYMPKDIFIEMPVSSFAIGFEVIEGNSIIINSKLVLKQRYISKERYPQFKNMIDKVSKAYNENIILEKKDVKIKGKGS